MSSEYIFVESQKRVFYFYVLVMIAYILLVLFTQKPKDYRLLLLAVFLLTYSQEVLSKLSFAQCYLNYPLSDHVTALQLCFSWTDSRR